MEGSITKRKDGRWQGTVEIPTLGNKRERKFVYAATRQECRRKINNIIEEIQSSGIVELSKLTFTEYAQKWLDSYCVNLSPSTRQGYRKNIYSYADKHIGNAVMSKIMPLHVQDMMNKFAQGHSRKTCKDLLAVVRAVFEYAKSNHLIKYNPCDAGIKLPDEDIERFDFYIYTEQEYGALLNAVTGSKEEIPILLAGMCGMRKSEVMGLMWNDIDFRTGAIKIQRAAVNVNGEVFIKTTKTRTSNREIIAPSYVIERLSIYKGLGYVFPKTDGTPENGNNYGTHFSLMLKRLGLPHTRFHDLRHHNATMLMLSGLSDKEISAWLGHSEINITKRYQHILENMKRRPADAMDKIVRRYVCQNVCQSG